LPICDLDHIYEPVSPLDYSITSVYWSGLSYEYAIESESMHASVHILDPDSYRKALADLNLLYFNTDAKEFTVSHHADMTLYTYKTGKFPASLLHYTIKTDGHPLEIYEVYNAACSDAAELETEIPYTVYIFGMEDEQYFHYEVRGLIEHPSAQWLSQFGIREYED